MHRGTHIQPLDPLLQRQQLGLPIRPIDQYVFGHLDRLAQYRDLLQFLLRDEFVIVPSDGMPDEGYVHPRIVIRHEHRLPTAECKFEKRIHREKNGEMILMTEGMKRFETILSDGNGGVHARFGGDRKKDNSPPVKVPDDIAIHDPGRASCEQHQQRPPNVREKHRHPPPPVDFPPRDLVQSLAQRQRREPHEAEPDRDESVIYREWIQRAVFGVERERSSLLPDLGCAFRPLCRRHRRGRRRRGGVVVIVGPGRGDGGGRRRWKFGDVSRRWQRPTSRRDWAERVDAGGMRRQCDERDDQRRRKVHGIAFVFFISRYDRGGLFRRDVGQISAKMERSMLYC